MRNPHQSSPGTSDVRGFAIKIIQKLRSGGHRALLAGGCVRDQLRGVTPKDYDVATSATPDEVQAIFGRGRTLAIGKQFGVIAVVSPRRDKVEVATFRRDLEYLDGRHPTGVEYASAEEDARRRDFTINGLFFDPITEEVIDYVGGQADLERRTIRAIGVPHDRFAEDKLRMLRAVRFATLLDFSIEPLTAQAISELSSQLAEVSAERIAAELRLILENPRRAEGMALLQSLGLLQVVLPEVAVVAANRPLWLETLDNLKTLGGEAHAVECALTLLYLPISSDPNKTGITKEFDTAARRLKLTNHEAQLVRWLLRHFAKFVRPQEVTWPTLQRLLISANLPPMLQILRACAGGHHEVHAAIDFIERKRSLPPAELDPAPLLNGDDLIRIGIPRGAIYARILSQVRDAQLLGEIVDQAQALALARRIAAESE